MNIQDQIKLYKELWVFQIMRRGWTVQAEQIANEDGTEELRVTIRDESGILVI